MPHEEAVDEPAEVEEDEERPGERSEGALEIAIQTTTPEARRLMSGRPVGCASLTVTFDIARVPPVTRRRGQATPIGSEKEFHVFVLPTAGVREALVRGWPARTGPPYQRTLDDIGWIAHFEDGGGDASIGSTEHHFHIEAFEVSTNPVLLDLSSRCSPGGFASVSLASCFRSRGLELSAERVMPRVA